MDVSDFDPPISAAIAMMGFSRPWCIAGGWAIDMWLGRVTRQHRRVSIAILRDHQIDLRDYGTGWRWRIVAMDKRLVEWKQTNRQMLMQPVKELEATDRAGRPMRIFLHESDGIDWFAWDCFEVRKNLSQWRTRTATNVPILAPEVALLIQARHPDEQGELDFRSVVDRLSDDQRTWLKLALIRTNPEHRWLERL